MSHVALVTGAGGEIGAACAAALAAAGSTIVVADVDLRAATATATALQRNGASARAVQLDVTDRPTVERVVADCAADGGVAILVNAAGVLRPTAAIDISLDEWNWVVGVNLTGTFLCSTAAIASMQREGWGRIVNISSSAGKNVSTVGGAHYTAAKAGVLGFTRHLAKEVAPLGITVNAVCPGLIDTDMVRSTISPEAQHAYAASFPIARLGTPTEVGDLVAFLASSGAGYITGASIDINGGDLMI